MVLFILDHAVFISCILMLFLFSSVHDETSMAEGIDSKFVGP